MCEVFKIDFGSQSGAMPASTFVAYRQTGKARDDKLVCKQIAQFIRQYHSIKFTEVGYALAIQTGLANTLFLPSRASVAPGIAAQ
ncbi:hypothetical protein [Paraburkholderia dinghuensis]|uniref:Uncharacterized protein n=1 Tax=Paraburkholderia dinghuensis TaxID=2305225 RepID=A0A3N6M785_9BURK|nr:hypothetical protein [Paraburkholderia dinghuensis]RQG99493.1 hypothetical protein D1Y85_26470 [Paraburkholderia dinghuensis]